MIGQGIFTTTGFLAGDLGTPKLVLSIWVVGAICAFLGAICYSELGVNLPSSGGEYVYLTRAFGPTWGFMTGWVSFFAGFSAPIAGVALAFAEYLGHVCVACVVVLVFSVLNLVGVQRVARAQIVLTGAKILILVAFIALGFGMGHGSW